MAATFNCVCTAQAPVASGHSGGPWGWGAGINPSDVCRTWIDLRLNSGELSGKEHSPTPRGSKGKIIYSRVSGVQIGSSRWTGHASLTPDPARSGLSIQQRACVLADQQP